MHPYEGLPERSFWSRSVTQSFDPVTLLRPDSLLLLPSDSVASMGSCFAANLVPYLESAGLNYVRTEKPPSQFRHLQENLGYRTFSAAYGNLYSSRQMLQLILRCQGKFQPVEDRWYAGQFVIDPFRPGLAHPAESEDEFEVLTSRHLAATKKAIELASVLVITLGLTEIWESSIDGAVFPACPGTVSGVFDPQVHAFRNLTAHDVEEDLGLLITELLSINPSLRIIITVSPVPLVATATLNHVLVANTLSKASLRVAAGAIEERHPHVTYFPAFEIVTGPQAPAEFIEADLRSVTPAGVDVVMGTLLRASGLETESGQLTDHLGDDTARASAESSSADLQNSFPLDELSARLAAAECDEVLLDSAGFSPERKL